MHVTVPFAGALHASHVVPHEVMLLLVFETQLEPLHGWKLALQLMPHVVPVQTASPLVGSAQAVQPVAVQPDAMLLLATQLVGAAAGQPWKLLLQVTLQVVPVQLAFPLLGFAHAVQPLAVQPDAMLLLATQLAPAPVPHM